MAYGPTAGLELLDQLGGEPALAHYHLLPSVRGDLFVKLSRHGEAHAEFARAAALTANGRECTLLLDRAATALARIDGEGSDRRDQSPSPVCARVRHHAARWRA